VSCAWPHPVHGHYLTADECGGVLFDSGSHALALTRMLLGRQPIVAVSAQANPAPHDTAATVRLRTIAGCQMRISLSWRADRATAEAHGERFVLTLSPARTLVVDGRPVALDAPERLDLWGDGGSTGPHDVLAGRRSPEVTTADALEDLEVITAAYASAARSGAEVALPYAGDPDLPPAHSPRNYAATSPTPTDDHGLRRRV
jgi:predicted dehydrogenase